MKKPLLSVIICTYNRAENLKKCLNSLLSQSNNNFEVVIIEGGSTDNSLNEISKFKTSLNIKTYTLKNSELAQARDLGWRKASGDYVSWIDDDVTVSIDWIDSVLKTFKNDPTIGGVSGPTLIDKTKITNRDIFFFYNKSGLLGFLAKFWNWFFLEGKMYEPGKLLKSGAWTPGSNFDKCLQIKGLIDVDYLEACNMSLKRELVKKVNGLNFSYKGIAEWSELDLAIRVKKLGYKLVFNKNVLVHHNISGDGAYNRRPQAKLRMENFYKFYFSHIFKLKLNYVIKFILYVQFLNCYWFYKFLQSKNIKWLGGLIGSLTGIKYAFETNFR